MEDEEFNDSNRAFVQAFLARGTLTFEDAKPILAAIFTIHEQKETLPEDVTTADLDSYMTAANIMLSPLDYEIRSTLHQRTRQRIYALVNTTSDALTQLATTFSPDEIAFVKRVLDAIFESQNTRRTEAMCIKGIDAVNQCAKPSESQRRESTQANGSGGGAGLTIRDAERVLSRLVEEGWFEKSDKGFLSLSARGLMELRSWLVQTYNDEDEDEGGIERVKMCQACKEIITVVGKGRNLSWASTFDSDFDAGPAMPEPRLSLSVARYMHAKFLPIAEVTDMPHLQVRMDRK
ncbi:MAG: hypothetical protein Q9227_009272 [Pyrenula ochraceoflavens]